MRGSRMKLSRGAATRKGDHRSVEWATRILQQGMRRREKSSPKQIKRPVQRGTQTVSMNSQLIYEALAGPRLAVPSKLPSPSARTLATRLWELQYLPLSACLPPDPSLHSPNSWMPYNFSPPEDAANSADVNASPVSEPDYDLDSEPSSSSMSPDQRHLKHQRGANSLGVQTHLQRLLTKAGVEPGDVSAHAHTLLLQALAEVEGLTKRFSEEKKRWKLKEKEWKMKEEEKTSEASLSFPGFPRLQSRYPSEQLDQALNFLELDPLLEQSKLPRYLRIESSEIELHEKIGSGGSAEIHNCRWENYDYAVKIFHAGDVVSLRKEVQNLIELPRHPNIVDVAGFSIRESDERPMVVMELLDCDLFTLIRTGEYKVESKFQRKKSRLTALLSLRKQLSPFPIGVAIDFIYQIATGMSFLHRRHIFHGDLKALNVLVKRQRDGVQLKISDFGFSEKLVIKPTDQSLFPGQYSGHLSDHSSFYSANAGTTRWMAPEVYGVADGDLEPYSMKADVYSFAMTCFEILTREIPFPDLFTNAVREYVREGGRPQLPRAKDVPEDLRQLIVRCWDGNPLQRPDFSEVCTCLQALKERFPLQI